MPIRAASQEFSFSRSCSKALFNSIFVVITRFLHSEITSFREINKKCCFLGVFSLDKNLARYTCTFSLGVIAHFNSNKVRLRD